MSKKNWIKSLRVKKGFTQEHSADLLGVHVRTWRRWENGELPVLTIQIAIKSILT